MKILKLNFFLNYKIMKFISYRKKSKKSRKKSHKGGMKEEELKKKILQICKPHETLCHMTADNLICFMSVNIYSTDSYLDGFESNIDFLIENIPIDNLDKNMTEVIKICYHVTVNDLYENEIKSIHSHSMVLVTTKDNDGKPYGVIYHSWESNFHLKIFFEDTNLDKVKGKFVELLEILKEYYNGNDNPVETIRKFVSQIVNYFKEEPFVNRNKKPLDNITPMIFLYDLENLEKFTTKKNNLYTDQERILDIPIFEVTQMIGKDRSD